MEQKSYRIALALGLGLLLGATVLLRQLFLLVIPFIFAWIWWSRRRHGGRSAIPGLILAGFLVLLMMLPFTYYNYTRFHRFVLLNTNAGYAIFFGNHPIYGTHFIPIISNESGGYLSLIPKELLKLDEAALDQALLKRAIGFIADDPGRYLLLSLSRIPVYFIFWPSADSGLVSNLSRVASFGLFLPFMIYGTHPFYPQPLWTREIYTGFAGVLTRIIWSCIYPHSPPYLDAGSLPPAG